MRHTNMPLTQWQAAARINGYEQRVTDRVVVAKCATLEEVVAVVMDRDGCVVGEWRGPPEYSGWMDIPDVIIRGDVDTSVER